MIRPHFNQHLHPDWEGELRLDYRDFVTWLDDQLFLRRTLGWLLLRNDDQNFPPKFAVIGFNPENSGRNCHVNLVIPVVTVQAYANMLNLDMNSLIIPSVMTMQSYLIDYLMKVPKRPVPPTRFDRLLGDDNPVIDDDT